MNEESVTELVDEYACSPSELMDDGGVCFCIHGRGAAWLSIKTVRNIHSAPRRDKGKANKSICMKGVIP